MDDNVKELLDNSDELLKELRELPKETKALQKRQDLAVDYTNKQSIDLFIIQRHSELIEDSLETLSNLREAVYHEPNAENIVALASFIAATTKTLESLSRYQVGKEKHTTLLDMKKMDIESRRDLQLTEHEHEVFMTREEIMKQIRTKQPDVIIDAEEVKDSKET